MTIRRLLSAALAALMLTACNSAPVESAVTTTVPVTTAAPAVTETTAAPVTTAAPLHDIDKMPRNIYGGAWDTSHVQGIAIDTEREYMYFSFTTVFVKTDLDGNIIGTVQGLTGHLGDLDFNDADGRVYGSLEFKAKNAFYIAIFDVDKIDRIGMSPLSDGVMTTVALPDVNADFTATVGGERYRYGCSGIDGVAFGPVFGEAADSPQKLMVAYGIFKDNDRADNDYQVILEYDWTQFGQYEKTFKPTKPHTDGPAADARYFAYTGNTNYGVQNLEYDAATGYWFMAVYAGVKPTFPNYELYAVDGSIKPVEGDIVGQPTPEKGLLLTLADEGEKHAATGVRGWKFKYGDTGMIALDDGYFYISHNGSTGGKQNCSAKLYRWVGGTEAFALVE